MVASPSFFIFFLCIFLVLYVFYLFTRVTATFFSLEYSLVKAGVLFLLFTSVSCILTEPVTGGLMEPPNEAC